jgi:nucleotide-binding universal stress UspA family protein
MTVSRILVASDFSEHSTTAERLGVSLACARKAEVLLIHVDQTPEDLEGSTDPLLPVRPELWRSYRDSTRRALTEALDNEANHLHRWGPGVTVNTRVDHGAVDQVIERVAREWPADLIVMGSHGEAANERYLFGSAVAAVLRRAPCPVLVTRASQVDRICDQNGFTHPLIAIDFSHFAEPSVRVVSSLASQDATFDLVHVWRPPLMVQTEGNEQLSEQDLKDLDAAATLALSRERERLDRFSGRLFAAEQRTRCTVEWGREASVLLDHARKSSNDVIVVGAHGPQTEDQLLIGSVADRILRHSPVPILFIPEVALSESQERDRSVMRNSRGKHTAPV